MTDQTRYSLYVLFAALVSAAGWVLIEIAIKFFGIPPILVTFMSHFLGGLILLALSARQSKLIYQPWTGRDWLRVVLVGLSIYALAFLAAYTAPDQIGAGKVTLLGQLQTPFIVALAIIFLKFLNEPKNLPLKGIEGGTYP